MMQFADDAERMTKHFDWSAIRVVQEVRLVRQSSFPGFRHYSRSRGEPVVLHIQNALVFPPFVDAAGPAGIPRRNRAPRTFVRPRSPCHPGVQLRSPHVPCIVLGIIHAIRLGVRHAGPHREGRRGNAAELGRTGQVREVVRAGNGSRDGPTSEAMNAKR